MGQKDTRVDVYINKSAAFAKPILNHLRLLVHKTCPDVQEAIKWGFPHFEYKGILCSMAAFKEHCAFGFWKASLMKDPDGRLSQMGETAMGHFGRLRSLDDLPPDKVVMEYIREATRLNEGGVSIPSRKSSPRKKEVHVPEYFMKALQKNKKALTTFEEFSYTNKKEYVDWIAQAKTETTRNSRLSTALEWMKEGKSRNWKYMRK